MTFLALMGTGLLAGVLGAMLGLGGGIFLVPALSLIFRLPMRVAVGTSLVGVIATSAGVGAVTPSGRGADVRLALRLGMFTAGGAIIGSWLAGEVSGRALSFLFAAVVFLTGAFMAYKAWRQGRSRSAERLYSSDYQVSNWPLGFSVTGIAGTLSGLLGVGGGFINVPLMYAGMEVPLGVATATSNFMSGVTATASALVYYSRGDLHPAVIVPTATGVFLGAMLGVYVLRRLRASWLRLILIGLLFLIGSQMLLGGLQG
jgi:uncharacterized membrane protein YfcA